MRLRATPKADSKAAAAAASIFSSQQGSKSSNRGGKCADFKAQRCGERGAPKLRAAFVYVRASDAAVCSCHRGLCERRQGVNVCVWGEGVGEQLKSPFASAEGGGISAASAACVCAKETWVYMCVCVCASWWGQAAHLG